MRKLIYMNKLVGRNVPIIEHMANRCGKAKISRFYWRMPVAEMQNSMVLIRTDREKTLAEYSTVHVWLEIHIFVIIQ